MIVIFILRIRRSVLLKGVIVPCGCFLQWECSFGEGILLVRVGRRYCVERNGAICISFYEKKFCCMPQGFLTRSPRWVDLAVDGCHRIMTAGIYCHYQYIISPKNTQMFITIRKKSHMLLDFRLDNKLTLVKQWIWKKFEAPLKEDIFSDCLIIRFATGFIMTALTCVISSIWRKVEMSGQRSELKPGAWIRY